MAKKLSVRGFELASILDKPHGDMQLILKIMDLENELEARSQGVQPADAWPEVCSNKCIQIDEWTDAAGYLRHPPDEMTWVESLTHKTALDVRAIVGELPTELGLFCMRIVYKKDGEIRQGTVKVWVLPAKD